MEVPYTKLHHLTAASTVESFFPFAPIGYTTRKFLMKGKSAAYWITSILMSKFGANDKKDQIPLYASFSTEDSDPKSGIYAMANNPTTSSSLLDYISMNCAIIVSEAIAGNKNASKATLQRLANHYSPQVRAAVIENRNAPFEILAYLSEDEHPDVRFALAENPHMPKSLLAKLANDDNPYIAARAGATLERLDSDCFCRN